MGRWTRCCVGLLCTLVSINLYASVKDDYYSSLDTNSEDLKKSLYNILNSYHKPNKKGGDSLLEKCSEHECYKHDPVTYKQAREYIFGYIHLENAADHEYQVMTYYCQSILSSEDLGKQIAPGAVPNNDIANVEHAWPQSHFNKKFPKAMQKADLHILFPEQSQVNSIRGNYPFGDVSVMQKQACETSFLGLSTEKERVFEPNDIVKGDMARAVFYYVTRYKVSLDDNQEKYLREWNAMDPVDDKEIQRNEKIFEIQHNRNPFVDKPELVELIENF